jgi:WD40 repeat protein
LQFAVAFFFSIPAVAAPPITTAAFAPGGKQILVGSQAGIEVRSWPELAPIRTIETRLECVHDLAFSPAGDMLAAGGGSAGESGDLEVFRWPDGVAVWHIAPHDDLIYSVAWEAGGRIATASADRGVAIVAADGRIEARLEGHSRAVLAARWLGDGATLVTGGADQTLRVWDAELARTLRTLDNHTGTVRGLAERPGHAGASAPLVASIAADRTVRFWQPTIGRLVRFARVESEPLSLAWTADGRRLAVGSVDGRVRILDPETVKLEADLPALDGWAYTLVAAPDGRGFLVGGPEGRLERVERP